MGFTTSTFFGDCCLVIASALQCRIIEAGFLGIDPVAETKKFSPFASYLTGQLRGDGIDEGKVIVAASIHAMPSFM